MSYDNEAALKMVEEEQQADVEANGWSPPVRSRHKYKPFPVSCLSTIIREYVLMASEASRCDPAMVALPVLSTVAASAGGARQLFLFNSWKEQSSIWTIIVSPGGTRKSTLLQSATQPLVDIDRGLALQNESAWENFREAKKDKGRAEELLPPIDQHCVADDVTTQWVQSALSGNPKGLLMYSSELGHLIGNFERYSGSGGGTNDAAFWNKTYDGEFWKSGRIERGSASIDRPVCSIAACVQPKILPRLLTPALADLGFSARFLLAQPPVPKRSRRSEAGTLDAEVCKRYGDLIWELRRLEFELDGGPVTIRCDEEAMDIFDQYHYELADDADEYEDHVLGPNVNRSHGHAARLALVNHLGVHYACPDVLIDGATAEKGVLLAKWFLAEAKRIYELSVRTGQDQRIGTLLAWLEKHPKSPISKIQAGCRCYRESVELLEDDLREAADRDWVYFDDTGRARYYFARPE